MEWERWLMENVKAVLIPQTPKTVCLINTCETELTKKKIWINRDVDTTSTEMTATQSMCCWNLTQCVRQDEEHSHLWWVQSSKSSFFFSYSRQLNHGWSIHCTVICFWSPTVTELSFFLPHNDGIALILTYITYTLCSSMHTVLRYC